MCLVPRVRIENNNSPDSIPIQNRNTVQKLKLNMLIQQVQDQQILKINFSKIEFAGSAYLKIFFIHKLTCYYNKFNILFVLRIVIVKHMTFLSFSNLIGHNLH